MARTLAPRGILFRGADSLSPLCQLRKTFACAGAVNRAGKATHACVLGHPLQGIRVSLARLLLSPVFAPWPARVWYIDMLLLPLVSGDYLQQPRTSEEAVADRIISDALDEETEQLDDELLALIATGWN